MVIEIAGFSYNDIFRRNDVKVLLLDEDLKVIVICLICLESPAAIRGAVRVANERTRLENTFCFKCLLVWSVRSTVKSVDG